MAYGLDLGNIFSLPPGTGLLLVYVLVYATIFGVIAFFGYRWYMYNYRVLIIEKRGFKDCIIGIDSGKLAKNKQGVTKFKLLKSRKILEQPEYDYVHNMKWGFMKNRVVVYYKFGEDSYTPIRISHKMNYDVTLTPIEADISQMVSIMDEINEKFDYRDFWDKYGTLIISGIMFAVLVVMLIFVSESLKTTVQGFGSASQQFVHAAETLASCEVPASAPGFGG